MTDSVYVTGEYLDRNPTFHVEHSPWKAARIANMLRRHAVTPRTVCEIGCGGGEILRQLQQTWPDARFFGYDISPQAIGLARSRENPGLEFHCENLLDAATDPFDVLLCIDVFEHVEDYMGFLRRLRGKADLKVFHIPLDLSVRNVLLPAKIMNNRRGVGHLHYFVKDTALATLTDTGYEVVDWTYTYKDPTITIGWRERVGSSVRSLLCKVNADLTARVYGGFSLLVLAR